MLKRNIIAKLLDALANCIEVKASATVGSQDFKGLKALAEATGERFLRGVVLYTGRESIPYGSSLHALSVDALWRAGASAN